MVRHVSKNIRHINIISCDIVLAKSVVVSTTSSVNDAIISTEYSRLDIVIPSSSVADDIITTDLSSSDTVIASSSTSDITTPIEFTSTFS